MPQEALSVLIWLIPTLPLLGFLANLLLVRNERSAGLVGSGVVGLAFVLALTCFGTILGWPEGQRYPDVVLWNWFTIGTYSVPFGLLFDPLTGVMTLLVTGVGFLIHVYSIGYMHGDPRATRFFAYLNLFVMMMLFLVMADNYLLLFLGWEGVGLCSFLLIGYYFDRKSVAPGISPANASVKAFVMNRIGDAAFLLALFIIFSTFGTLTFFPQQVGGELVPGVLERAEELLAGREVVIGVLGSWLLATAIAFLMLIAVSGKSAQIPLFMWLPDAMAGPTPVSALIHAATMVTSGIYLIVRSHSIFELSPAAGSLTVWVGTLTALVGALAAVAQWDIKRVLAYSTVSQLGFMVAAAGMGAYGAAMFHLLTHGIFKALLFLGSGSVIHGAHETQDMRLMGGLKDKMPWTFRTYLMGTLALAGIFPLAGFWSKDEIIAFSVFHEQSYAIFLILFFTSLLTAFYMGRQIALVFFGKQRDTHYTAHESGNIILVPLMILALGAILGGLINIPGLHPLTTVLEPVLGEEAAEFGLREIILAAITTLAALGSGVIGFRFYLSRAPKIKAGSKDPLYPVTGELWDLASTAMGFDALARYFRRGYQWAAGALSDFDVRGLDGLVDSIGRGIGALGNGLRGVQTGYVRNYALVFLLGVVIIVAYFAFASSAGLSLGTR